MANDFDLDHFRQLMSRDGLRFEDEQSDVLNLFAIAEERNGLGFETYQLAKSTAVSKVISAKRMREKIAQNLFPLTLVLRKRPLSRKQKQNCSAVLGRNQANTQGDHHPNRKRTLATDGWHGLAGRSHQYHSLIDL